MGRPKVDKEQQARADFRRSVMHLIEEARRVARPVMRRDVDLSPAEEQALSALFVLLELDANPALLYWEKPQQQKTAA